jgi:aryl-alcohol dehydrogenase-like predicted oxidoreductase
LDCTRVAEEALGDVFVRFFVVREQVGVATKFVRDLHPEDVFGRLLEAFAGSFFVAKGAWSGVGFD